MSKEVKRHHYSVSVIVMLSIGGSIFAALAIAILVQIIKSLVRFGGGFDWFILVPILLFVVLPLAFASIAFSIAGKELFHWIREVKTKKSGYETTAQIADYKVVCHKGTKNKRYALVLSYKDNGETKTFTTYYIFEINEFRYLKSLESIKIRVHKNFVAVVEPFTEDIYKLDSKYEVELDFYKQKPVAKTLSIWRVCCITALVLLVVSIVLTTTLNNGLYLIIGVCLLLAANFPFAIILAVYLIRWIWGSDREKFKRSKYKRKQAEKNSHK